MRSKALISWWFSVLLLAFIPIMCLLLAAAAIRHHWAYGLLFIPATYAWSLL